MLEDYNHALGLINEIALEKIYFGELIFPLEWIKGIPDNVLRQWPMVLVFYAWVLIGSNLQFDIADTYLMIAQGKLTEIVDKLETVDDRDLSTITLSDARLLDGSISVIRSYSARLRGDLKNAIPLAERALDFLPKNQYVFRTWASWNLAEAYRYLGNIPGWGKALKDAIASCELTQNPGAILLTFDNLAEMQVMRGELYKAEKTWNDLLKRQNDMLEGKEIPIAATIYAGLGMLYYEWNKFDLAVRHLDKAIELANLGKLMEIYLESHITLARLHYVCGDRESAIRIIDDLESIIRSNPINRHSIRAKAYRALWEFDRGDRGYVSHWKQERQFSKEMLLEFSHESEYFIISRMLIEERHFQEALDLLLSLEDAAGSSGRVNSKIKALMLISVAYEGLGRNSESLSQIEKALILAEPGGYIRTFLEARGNIIDLLKQCVSRGIKRDYVYRILAIYHNQTKHLEMIQTLHEPLSDREIEVLKLVVARLTSREIADILKISVNTVRTHTRNIYSKLNVHNHVEANCRAKEIGII